MKIAFCFSGQLRTWRRCLSTWNKFAKVLEDRLQAEVDFFSHTWNCNSSSNMILTKDWTKTDFSLITDKELKEYCQNLNLKNFIIDDMEKCQTRYFNIKHILDAVNFNEQKTHDVTLSWAASQFYSVMKSAFLKKQYEMQNNIRYNIVFRLRNDLYFTDENIDQFFGINQFNGWKSDLHTPQINTIYSCHTANDLEWPFTRVGDIFFYADSVTFDKICEFYRWLPHLEFHRISHLFQNQTVSTERTLFYYLKMMKIKINPIFIDPKICRDEEYRLARIQRGLGDLGGFEIV